MQPQQRQKRGQTILEFALILPAMLLVTYGLIELGRAMFVYAAANNAAREASRYGASAGENEDGIPYYQDCKGMRDIVRHFAFLAQPTDIQIAYDHGTPDTTFAQCPADADRANVSLTAGDRVRVTITVAYHPFFLFSTDTATFTFNSAHTVVKEVLIANTGGGGGGGGGGSNPPPQNTPTPTNTPNTPTPTPTYTPALPTNTPTPITPTNTPTPTVTPAPIGTPIVNCNVQYTTQGSWWGWPTATITIHWMAQQGLHHWKLVWIYANGQSIESSYDDDGQIALSQSGETVTAQPVSQDDTIAANGERSFSFDYSGSDDPPTSFTLSGTLDDGTYQTATCSTNTP